MTKEEFIAKQQTMNRRMNKRCGWWVALFFGGLLACIPLLRYIERHEEEYRWIATVLGIGVMLFLSAAVAAAIFYGLKEQRRFGHRCPHCKKPLIGISAQLAIASGNCGQCGNKVFSDDIGQPE